MIIIRPISTPGMERMEWQLKLHLCEYKKDKFLPERPPPQVDERRRRIRQTKGCSRTLTRIENGARVPSPWIFNNGSPER